MLTRDRSIKISKFLSLILRYEPQKAGISLDSAEWVETELLPAGCERAGFPITRAELSEVVANSSYSRSEIMSSSADDQPAKVIGEGKHIRLVAKGKWEFAQRKKVSGIVCIIAVTDDEKLVLIEQYRAAVGKSVIELPAGLAGDVEGHETEELAEAARRELLEETGYEAKDMTFLADGAASAGITDEIISLFRAARLRKAGEAKGDGSEQITVHEVPVGKVFAWLETQRRLGKVIDLKVYGGIYFAGRK